MTSSERTSCVEFVASVHGEQRRIEREISKRDLKAAVKYGREEITWHPNKRIRRYKFTYNNIVYITDESKRMEVTSYPLIQLPLEKVEIDESLQRQIAEQKRRIINHEAAITSHSVLIIDQSGSMRNSDVVGHRSRSQAVFYTIANEMIAVPLLAGKVSFTDVVTLIEMRDDAVISISKEPITWELHNMIVDLARKPLRPRGMGNYLPALSEASRALSSTCEHRCALMLLFLSDGWPSDQHKGFPFSNVHDFIRESVTSTCSQFGNRLTFGTFGFAHDCVRKCGLKTFHLLESMTQVAAEAGSQSFFAYGQDRNNLRKALFTMSSSLLSTRNGLSSLAGGSLLRISGPYKVKRTDLQKDQGDGGYNLHYVHGDGLRRAVARQVMVDDTYDVDWNYLPLMHPDAVGIAIKTGFIEKGAERATYEMFEVRKDDVKVGRELVAKFSIHEEVSQISFHKQCAFIQFEALRIANKFNERLDQLQAQHSVSYPHIRFLQPCFYEWFEKDGTTAAALCEERLDNARFKK